MLGCWALARAGTLAPSSAGCCHSLGFRGLSPREEVAIYSGDDWKQPFNRSILQLGLAFNKVLRVYDVFFL